MTKTRYLLLRWNLPPGEFAISQSTFAQSPAQMRHVPADDDTFRGGYDGKTQLWLAFLNTVRTQHFDQVLSLRPLLPAIVKAA